MVLIDGGSGLNVLFTNALMKMKLDITNMLTKSAAPFYGIVPDNASIPLGSVVLPVTSGEMRENYRTEYIMFEVPDYRGSAHQEEVQMKAIDLGTSDNSETTMIGIGLDPK
jgi:hypothetical protein